MTGMSSATSAASCNVGLVTGPGPNDGVNSEIALGSGASVAPAYVSVDHFSLPGMGAVVSAVGREVPQGGEFGFVG